MNETYFDPTFGGLDWEGIHDRYRPKIAGAEEDEEFYGLINAMLWELKVSHANLVPPGSLALYEPLVFAKGSPGIDVRLIDGEAVITSVKPGSPAHQAGLSPGYVIQAIDGVPAEQIVRAVVVGERSPRIVMESDTMILPNGAVFMYPVAQLAVPDGTVLEGHGVVPDIEVGLNREMLLKGIDSQLDAAIQYIEKETQKQK